MKTILLFVTGMLMATMIFSQNIKEYTNVEIAAPQFKGELFESINDFLTNAVQYPSQSKNMGLQGTEVIEFKVTTDGKIKNFKVVNSISSEIDREVIRVLQVTSGKWKPGLTNGEPVDMKKEVSVTFIASSEKELVKEAKELQERGNHWMFVKNKPEKAIKYYDQGIRLLPFEESLLAARSLCKYELSDTEGALADWERIKNINEIQMSETNFKLADNYKKLSGYKKMLTTLENR
jgi:TonB family protein